jgi:4-hydroxybenzoate polyprenyltransferase
VGQLTKEICEDLAGSGTVARIERTKWNALVKLARPYQWLKNGLVFAALVFSQRLFHFHDLVLTVVAFVAFCAISSAGYAINDINDRESDRHHPEKRNRPLVSGEVTVGEALTQAAVFGLSGIALSAALGPRFLAIAAAYLAMQFLYSHCAKHVVIIDVIVIAIGFVLRAYAGGVALDVAVSPWLAFITFVLALLIALARRRHELIALGAAAIDHRGPLGEYSVKLIDQMLSIVAGATLVGYMIYTASPEVAQKLGTQHLFLTVPFVAFGILRYLYLVNECNEGGDPARLVLRDRPLLISILLWISADILLLYFSPVLTS